MIGMIVSRNQSVKALHHGLEIDVLKYPTEVGYRNN